MGNELSSEQKEAIVSRYLVRFFNKYRNKIADEYCIYECEFGEDTINLTLGDDFYQHNIKLKLELVDWARTDEREPEEYEEYHEDLRDSLYR